MQNYVGRALRKAGLTSLGLAVLSVPVFAQESIRTYTRGDYEKGNLRCQVFDQPLSNYATLKEIEDNLNGKTITFSCTEQSKTADGNKVRILRVSSGVPKNVDTIVYTFQDGRHISFIVVPDEAYESAKSEGRDVTKWFRRSDKDPILENHRSYQEKIVNEVVRPENDRKILIRNSKK